MWERFRDPDWKWKAPVELAEKPVIGLIYPPSLFLDNPRAQPPLGLMSIAAILTREDFPVRFHDWANETDWRSRLDEVEESIVGTYAAYPHFNFTKLLYGELRSRGKRLIVGGPDPSGHPEDYLDRSDAVVAQEGELSVFLAIHHVLHDGVAKVFSQPNIMNLDALPWPLRTVEGFSVHNYTQEFHGRNITTTMFSRGCFAACTFCNSKSIWGRQVRWRSPRNAADEVLWLREQYGYDRFLPEDDTFNTDNAWVAEFCRLIKDEGFLWRVLTRAIQLTPEICRTMHDAGCRQVSIGLESGSEKILKSIMKGENVAQQMRGIKTSKAAGLNTAVFVIVGLPGETPETIEETKRFLAEARPDRFDLTLLRPFPDMDIVKQQDKLDIEFLPHEPEMTWYKGGLPKALARTAAMSAEDLERAYTDLYEYCKDLGMEHSVGHYVDVDKYPQIKQSLS